MAFQYTFGQDFGGSFADAYFKTKQLSQQQEQFDAKLAEEKNQQSMLMAFREQQSIQKPYENFSQAGYWDTSGGTPKFIPNTQLPQDEKFGNFSEKGYWDKSSGQPKWIANPDYKEKSGLTDNQQMMQQERLEKKEEKRSAGQQLYNEIMDSYDPKIGKYVIMDSRGFPMQLDEKGIEREAARQVIKGNFGKINFWKRSTQKKSEAKTDTNKKVKPY